MNRKFELVSGEGSGGNSYVSLDSDGTVRVNKNLDYEAFSNPVISIRVRCTDYTTESIKNCERQIGFTKEEVFKINVLDVLERPPEPPAPTQNQIYSAFGGGVTGKDWFVTIGSKTYGFPASMPLLLRVYGGGILVKVGFLVTILGLDKRINLYSKVIRILGEDIQ